MEKKLFVSLCCRKINSINWDIRLISGYMFQMNVFFNLHDFKNLYPLYLITWKKLKLFVLDL